jgi:hypothetical protein
MLVDTMDEALRTLSDEYSSRVEERASTEWTARYNVYMAKYNSIHAEWHAALAVEYAADLAVETQQEIHELVFGNAVLYDYQTQPRDQEEHYARLAQFVRSAIARA